MGTNNSVSEASPVSGGTATFKKFNSPLTALKTKVTFAKKATLLKKGNLLASRRSNSERELELDNSEYLSSLMSLKAGNQPVVEIDKSFASSTFDRSFASDFDESARWLKQHLHH